MNRFSKLVIAAACSIAAGCSGAPNETTDAAEGANTTVTPGAAWAARHGMTSAEYQAEFNARVAAGYRLTWVSGYAVGNQALYASIFERSSGPAWVARHGMTAAQYQTEFNTQLAAGYRLALVNGYTVNGVDYFAALWDKAPVGAWQARHGLSATDYQNTFNTLVAQGYRLRHVSGYGANGNQTFAAIWEKAGGPAWIAKHGMTAAEYQHEFDVQNAAGYHLTLVNGYPVGTDARYVAIWEQGAVVPWQARHGVKASDYQQTFDDMRYQGYRPIVVSGYGVGGQTDYAAVFQNYSYSAKDLAHIDSVVNGMLTSTSTPAISIAITKGGRLVFAKAYGYADKDAKTPATTASRFRIASISKPFTANAIMELVEANKITLDEKVFGTGSILGTTYTTSPKDSRVNDITVRQLLTHTSGFWTNDGNDPMFQHYEKSQSQLITWALENQMLTTKPGATYAYSNFGFLILGRIIEKVTGQAYDAWMKSHVLAQSGITDMQIAGDTLAARAPNEVVYYSTNGDPYGIDVSRMDSHGGWIATPIDLVRLAVHMDGYTPPADLLTASDVTLMATPTAQSIAAGSRYGFGLLITTVDTRWHDGSLPGTRSIMARTSKTAATSPDLTWSAIANSRDNGVDVDGMMWNVVSGVTFPGYDLF